jgi:molybdopterin/thiamine biosynthesis adenylyltransferase/proteasome lid subunit RPN8/RPN11
MQFKTTSQPERWCNSNLIVAADWDALNQITEQCKEFLRLQQREVELGGLTIGWFDGTRATIKELILDKDAESTPINIRLSTKIFSTVEQHLKDLNRGSSDPYILLGTWHGHPGSSNTPSTIDRTTLFQEPIRLRTDDPGLAKAPYVHLIFRDFGRTCAGVKAFTMRLACTYYLRPISPLVAAQTFCGELAQLIESGIWLGVLWSTDGGKTVVLKPYHPDTFMQYKYGQGLILGLWKYYPYPQIEHEFEKVFLENFFQKVQIPQFNYVRLLLPPSQKQPNCEWFECQRQRGVVELAEIVDFVEIPLEKVIEITCQNPDTAQTSSLSLSPTTTVQQIAGLVAAKNELTTPPTLFTYFQREKAEQFASRALVQGEEIVLPDNLTLAEIKDALKDPRLPIYYRTVEIDSETLFKLRTLRFRQQGYAVDELRKAKVLIGGVGLLGSEIALNLAILGVGSITVIDNGIVDWYNIYRQGLFDRCDVYKRKVDVVKERLEDMGIIEVRPLFIEVPCWGSSLSHSEMLSNLRVLDQAIVQADIVVGAFDRFSPRAVMQAICLARERPFVVAALDGRMGRVVLYDKADDGCYCCGSPDPRQGRWYDGGVCTLASLESQRIVASFATKLIVERLQGKSVPYNRIDFYAAGLHIELHKVRRSESCSLCSRRGANARSFIGDNLAEAVITWLSLEGEENREQVVSM